MPLIICPDCNGSISDEAPACIHCGRPMKAAAQPTPQPTPQPKPKSQPTTVIVKRETSGCAWMALAFFILMALSMCINFIEESNQPNNKSTPQKQTNASRSTPGEWNETDIYWDIHLIAGLYPANVEKILGKHTDSEETKHGLKYTYQDGEVAIVFIDGGADWITITPTYTHRLPFKASSIQALGIRASAPDFSTDDVKRWNNNSGLISISMFPSRDGFIDYFYIKCRTP